MKKRQDFKESNGLIIKVKDRKRRKDFICV
jgi:hypothetical protein